MIPDSIKEKIADIIFNEEGLPNSRELSWKICEMLDRERSQNTNTATEEGSTADRGEVFCPSCNRRVYAPKYACIFCPDITEDYIIRQIIENCYPGRDTPIAGTKEAAKAIMSRIAPIQRELQTLKELVIKDTQFMVGQAKEIATLTAELKELQKENAGYIIMIENMRKNVLVTIPPPKPNL